MLFPSRSQSVSYHVCACVTTCRVPLLAYVCVWPLLRGHGRVLVLYFTSCSHPYRKRTAHHWLPSNVLCVSQATAPYSS